MNKEQAEKLYQLGFRPSKNNTSEHSSWSQFFRVGNAKVVLCIREFGAGIQYGFLVANKGKTREQEQWMEADDIMSAICSLNATGLMVREAKRELEGSVAKRTWRELIGQPLARLHSWLLAGEHGVQRFAGEEVEEGGTI